MTPSIVDRSGVMTADLEGLVERRLRFALSRFEGKIQGVSIVLDDVNGPRGGADQSCRIEVRMRAGTGVVISHQDVTIASCLTRAIDRAGRAVARTVERQRGLRRT